MTTSTSTISEIPAELSVRYIKLGEGGRWEKECIEKGIIRFGFGTARPERLPLCLGRRWGELAALFTAEGKTPGTATRFANEARCFFQDAGETVWITFVGEHLWWGMLDAQPPQPHTDGDGVYRSVAGGWRCKDLKGGPLTKDRLSGALTKLAAYRGTSCGVDVAAYVIRRINGRTTPEVERALGTLAEMKSRVLDLIRLLGPRDFETLVDLVFSTSGWQRQGPVGKAQKTLDLDLLLPSTGERCFVQIKSSTTSAQLADYVSSLDDLGPYERMFFVYHSGEAVTDDERVVVIGPEKLSELVLDAGLVSWLIRKTS